MPKMVANDSWIRELALTARRATSGEAKENGLVSRVYDNQQQALNGALEMAASITNNSPVAVQGTKLCLNYSRDHSIHDGLVWALNWNMVSDNISDSQNPLEQSRSFIYRHLIFTQTINFLTML